MDDGDRVWRERGLRDAVLTGDERAWRAWYDACYADLERYVLWRCGGLRDRSEEVVQETWLTAVRLVGRFRPEQGSFAAWLHGIAANVIRNHLRRARMQRLRNTPLIVDVVADVGQASAERERAERVAHALADLSERCERALRAKYLDGLEVAVIAERWGETPKAVESLLTRARQAFREAYERQE
jgi:RNA polymerase sigma-70 factor (ECF subfamily)